MAKIKELENALARLQSENEELQAGASELKTANKALEEREHATRVELTSAQAAAGGHANLKSQLRDAKAEAARCAQDAEAAREELEALKEINKSLKAKEKAARAELAVVQNSSGGDDKLRNQVREAKAQAAKFEEDAEEAREELETLKETNNVLKAKYREERVRVAGIEEELQALKSIKPTKASTRKDDNDSDSEAEPVRKTKAAKASPSKPRAKSKARKVTPASDSEDESSKKRPKKDAVKEKSKSTSRTRKPLVTADVNGDSDNDAKSTRSSSEPEKKKKRKLFGGAQPAFNWDPILSVSHAWHFCVVVVTDG